MLGYLGVPFASVAAPLAVWLLRARGSAFVGQHARQALNLAITVALYNVCALILGAMLALDTVRAALVIALPAATALWAVTLAYLVRAAAAAGAGGYRELPAWLCAAIVGGRRARASQAG